MMRRCIALLIGMVLVAAAPAMADYFFRVDKNLSDVYVNRDGSITLDYMITFTCEPSGKAIDIVDIGLPNKHYDPDDFSAWINDTALSTVRQSEYVDIGVEIPLGNKTIRPGQSGTLRVKGKIDRMVYEDDDDSKFTSVEFAPTYFGSGFTTGSTHMEIRMHFPPGVTGDFTKYHKVKPDVMDAGGDHIVFTWVFPATSPSGTKQVGIGFPVEFVDKVHRKTVGDCMHGCFAALGGLFMMILIPWVFPFGIIAAIVVLKIQAKKRRLLKYLPPELSVEGVGVKRGLTAPEAALLQEMPLDRILIMILFGLLKKNVVNVRNADPLKLKLQKDHNQKLRVYETGFLECIKKDGGFSKKRGGIFLIKFIKDTNRKLKGYSRLDTLRYYRKIADEAWTMVEKASTPKVVGEAFDRRAQWLLMTKDFDERLSRSVHHETVDLPRWWTFSHGGHGSPTPGDTGGVSMSLSDFANATTNSISNFSEGLVGSVSNFTSSITGKTNPPPVSTGSYSGGGGGSCACACACAGCACACAGGGR